MINISVIVPVYNAEKYLATCLISILKQTNLNIEIICINDGSIDSCEHILKTYQKLDSRIQIITQNNRGVSSARNRGIEVATGNYICFIDSDDWIEDHFFEKMYETAIKDNCDVVVCNYHQFLENENILIKGPTLFGSGIVPKEVILSKLITDELRSYSPIKLWKRSVLLGKHKIQFPQDSRYLEDVIFHIKFFSKAKNFSYVNQPLYNYRMHNESKMGEMENNFNKKCIRDYMTSLNIIYETLLGCKFSFKEEFKARCIFVILEMAKRMTKDDSGEGEYNLDYNIVKKYKIKILYDVILNNNVKVKQKILFLLYKFNKNTFRYFYEHFGIKKRKNNAYK